MRTVTGWGKLLRRTGGCIVLLSSIGTTVPARDAAAQSDQASARGTPSIVVDGSDWMAANANERRAFLVGVANMIVAEGAYARRNKHDLPPVSDRIIKAVSHLKFADIESHITQWYEAHPAKRSMPVMGVVWQSIVGKRR